jgi:deoxycytidine triphosphate deaminase
MYLSDTDLRTAIQDGSLIFDPPPAGIDPTSIDLHLDRVEEAKVWDTQSIADHLRIAGGNRPEVRIANYNYATFSGKFLRPPPDYDDQSAALVQRRVRQVIVRPMGFLLWQTKETVGTPADAALICFVNTKSTKARAGVIVHCTAPTIHSTWAGKITLEIVNLGSFDLVLQEDDIIAQLTVARITSAPVRKMSDSSATYGQQSVEGKPK